MYACFGADFCGFQLEGEGFVALGEGDDALAFVVSANTGRPAA